jgi:hypothetical protein
MVDEIARLKAALVELNTQCQLARDNEVRYALQRGRLEAERAQLLVKLMDVRAALAPTPLPEAASPPYRIIVHEPTTASPFEAAGINGAPAVVATLADVASVAVAGAVSQEGRKGKPPGLPSMTTMVSAALNDAAQRGHGLTPREVGAFIQQKWWPNATQPAIRAISGWVCRMAKEGQLTRDDSGRYTVAKPKGAGIRTSRATTCREDPLFAGSTRPCRALLQQPAPSSCAGPQMAARRAIGTQPRGEALP